MPQDNHIWSTGSITNAVKKARQAAGFSMKIEVECQSVAEAVEAAAAGADVVMLDNFTHDTIAAAAADVKAAYPHVLVEASGVRALCFVCHRRSPYSFFCVPRGNPLSPRRASAKAPCICTCIHAWTSSAEGPSHKVEAHRSFATFPRLRPPPHSSRPSRGPFFACSGYPCLDFSLKVARS